MPSAEGGFRSTGRPAPVSACGARAATSNDPRIESGELWLKTRSVPPFFWELHRGLPRQGPGDNASTGRAFRAAGPLPRRPVVVDVGCGPGMQTLELARLLHSRVVALGNHAPFLRELTARAVDEVAELVDPLLGDARQLPFATNTVDLLWSEGAIYIVGFERGLRTWRPALRSDGVVAVSEATWLRTGAPDELRRFWDEGYPAMVGREDNARTAEQCGYRVLDQFTLPADAWWTHYYDPLVDRLREARAHHAGDEAASALVDAEELEIDMFRKYHDYYGYVFYVLKRVD